MVMVMVMVMNVLNSSFCHADWTLAQEAVIACKQSWHVMNKKDEFIYYCMENSSSSEENIDFHNNISLKSNTASVVDRVKMLSCYCHQNLQ